MDRFQDALTLIAGIIAAAAPLAGASESAWLAKAQGHLDKAAGQVVDEADGVRRRFRITNVDPAVERFVVQRAVLPPSGELDVLVDVVQSAQQAALYLNVGGSQIDLGAQTSALVLEVAGRFGVRELSFSSGTTVQTIAHVIRTFGPPGGLTAEDTQSGVMVRSIGTADQEFVSVRVVNDGGIQAVAPAVGIYRMLDEDAGAPDPETRINFDSIQAFAGVHDRGQDVRARITAGSISGQVTGQGTWVWIDRPRLRAAIDLAAGPLGPGMTANAQNLGLFRAFTIERWP